MKRRLWSCFSFILAPWIIVLILREVGPITHPPLSSGFFQFIALFLASATIGYILGIVKITPSLNKKIVHQHKSSEVEFKLILSTALIYMTLTAADFFILKDGSLTSITLVREEDNLLGARMSSLGGLIAITSAAPFILLNKIRHDWLTNKILRSKGTLFLAITGISMSFLSGGRNSFLIGVVIYLIQEYFLKNIKNSSVESKGKIASLFIVTGIVFSFYVFLDRELNQGVTINQLLSIFAMKWGVQIEEFQSNMVFFDAMYAAIVMLIFYLTHALNYVDQYFINNVSPMLLGIYNNPIPTKIIDIIFGYNLFSSAPEKLLISGVYLSFPGSLYVDFGWIGSNVLGLLIGSITGLSLRLMSIGSFLAVQLNSLLMVIWILAPLYSVIGISNGLSFLVIGAVLYFAKLFKI